VIGAVALLTSASPLPRVVRSSGEDAKMPADEIIKTTNAMTDGVAVVPRDGVMETEEEVTLTAEDSMITIEDAKMPSKEVTKTNDGIMETAQMVMMTPVIRKDEVEHREITSAPIGYADVWKQIIQVGKNAIEAVRAAEDSTDDFEATETLIEAAEAATVESLSETFESSTDEAIVGITEDSEDSDARSDVDAESDAEVSTEKAIIEATEAETEDTLFNVVETITELPVEANKVRSEDIEEEMNDVEDTSEVNTRDAEASTEEPLGRADEITTVLYDGDSYEDIYGHKEVEASTDRSAEENNVRSDDDSEVSTELPINENLVRSDVNEVEDSTDLPVEENEDSSDDDEVDNSTDEPIEEETSTDIPEENDRLRSNLPIDLKSEDSESTTNVALAEATEAVTEMATDLEKSEIDIRSDAGQDEMVDTTTAVDIEAIEVSTDSPSKENKEEMVEDTKARDDLKDEESDSETTMETAESSTDTTLLSIQENEEGSDDDDEESMDNKESEEASTDETPIEEEEESTESPVEESESSTLETRTDIEGDQKYWDSMKEITVESELDRVAEKYGLKATPEVSYEVEEEKDQSSFASTIIANIKNSEMNIEEPTAIAMEDKKEIIDNTHLDNKYATKEEEKDSNAENKYEILEEENETHTDSKYETLEKEKPHQSQNKYATLEGEQEEPKKRPTTYGNRIDNKEVKENKRESLINRFKTEDESKNELRKKRKFLASRRFFTARTKN